MTEFFMITVISVCVSDWRHNCVGETLFLISSQNLYVCTPYCMNQQVLSTLAIIFVFIGHKIKKEKTKS